MGILYTYVEKFANKISQLHQGFKSIPGYIIPGIQVAREMLLLLKGKAGTGPLTAQTAGLVFEDVCLSFLRDCFAKITHLRPGKWVFFQKPFHRGI